MIKRAVSLVVVFSLCAGCATYPPLGDAQDALENSPVCCSSFREISYRLLMPGDTAKVELDLRSSAYNFDTGKSFFSAFKLPQSDTPLEVTVKSYFAGDVFYPVVTILNSKHEVTRKIGVETFRYVEPGLIERGHVGGTFVATTDMDETFVIVHTTSELVGRSLTTNSEGYAYAIGTTPVVVPNSSYTHMYTTVGSISVLVTGKLSD